MRYQVGILASDGAFEANALDGTSFTSENEAIDELEIIALRENEFCEEDELVLVGAVRDAETGDILYRLPIGE